MRDRRKTRALEQATRSARRAALVQHFASAFHDPPERHTRGTRGLAGTADQTTTEVTFELVVRRALRGDQHADELDAAARRVRLVPEHTVRRAVVQTEATRDARGQVLGAHVHGIGGVGR